MNKRTYRSTSEPVFARKMDEEELINVVNDAIDEGKLTELTEKLADKADLVDGKVPAEQLPSYVDDVIEGYLYEGQFYKDEEHQELIEPELNKIYVDLSTNDTYRYSGTQYVQIGGQDLSDYQPLITEENKLDISLVDIPEFEFTANEFQTLQAGETLTLQNNDGRLKLIDNNLMKIAVAGSNFTFVANKQRNNNNVIAFVEEDYTPTEDLLVSYFLTFTAGNQVFDVKLYKKSVKAGAQPNVIEKVKVDNVDLVITNKAVNIDLSGKQNVIDSSHKLSADLVEDGSTNKVFTSTEQTKLSNIASGAQVNVLEGVQVNGTDLAVSNKKVNIDLSGKQDKLTAGNNITIDSNNVISATGGGSGEVLNAKLKVYNWEQIQFSGLTSIYGSYVWTDGENIYHSMSSNHHILDKATRTWTAVTFNGLTSFNGNQIWTDGENIYYSSGFYSSNNHYVLDKSTRTWTAKTWNGATNFNGEYIWTDGENIYVSGSGIEYVLDKATSTWSAKTWTGHSPSADYLWTDGRNIYSSSGSNHYVLDKATSTWSAKTWSGLTNFSGGDIWTDGENIYASGSEKQYVLDLSQATFIEIDIMGTLIGGTAVWSDGENIYASNGMYMSDKNYIFKQKQVDIHLKIKN